jgi:hypothetical protein
VTDTNPDNHFGAIPAINLVKLTNGTDNDTATRPRLVPVGSTVTFTYQVTNPGNVPLSGVTVTDDRGPWCRRLRRAATTRRPARARARLDLHRRAIATAGPYHQRRPATGTPPPGGGTAGDRHQPRTTTSAPPGDRPRQAHQRHRQRRAPASSCPVGSTVTFTYVVTNPGNVPLSGRRWSRRHGRRHPADDFAATSSAATPTATACSTRPRPGLHRRASPRPASTPTSARPPARPPPGAGPPVTDTNPGQPLRRRARHQPRQAHQRHRQRRGARSLRPGRQHGHLHLRRDQPRQRPAGHCRRHR